MKTYLHIAIFLLFSSFAHAQKNFFIYLQTDNKQPFFVKMRDKVMSSSSSGYLVIPKLTIGDYQLTVGFPKDQWPQQAFNINIADKDLGYLLKNFEENGWGLYNMQTMEISMNGKAAVKQKPKDENDDAFAATLSGAANAEIIVKKTPVAPVVIEESPKVEPAKQPIKKAQSKIDKIETFNDVDGKSITYAIFYDNTIDTVRVFIPIGKAPAKPIDKTAEPVKQAVVKKEEKFLDIELPNPNSKPAEPVVVELKSDIVPIAKEEPKKASDKPTVNFNSDCRAFATEDDFFKARKKMVAEDNDEAMVDAARKIFKTKCFSVEQIKNLSLLFLNDNSKYNFFDAAYPHASDSQNFLSLQAELKDEYYIKRFKAMVRN